MIVQILGAKMLAPFIGTSHFVWTAQIAVTLMALAVGYYAGGKLVDRSPRLERLYWAVIVAAIYLAGTVTLVEPLAFWCLKFKLAVGSLLASALLFFVPLGLLAMVGPFFVRVLTVAVAGVGGNMGRLTAISTFGSFVGTMLIGYLLVPFLRNSVTMYLVCVVLLAVAAGYFVVWGRRQTSLAKTTAALVGGLALGGLGVWRDQAGPGQGLDGNLPDQFQLRQLAGVRRSQLGTSLLPERLSDPEQLGPAHRPEAGRYRATFYHVTI